MRILDREGISYDAMVYDYDESDLSGVHVAEELGLPPEEIFKTLVTRAHGRVKKDGSEEDIVVFVIPVAESLDLKKAAVAAGRKKVEMVHVKEIENLTGYIRGGCSPIGMKKEYPVFVHRSAGELDRIYVSAGRRGLQIKVDPKDILNVTAGAMADLITGTGPERSSETERFGI